MNIRASVFAASGMPDWLCVACWIRESRSQARRRRRRCERVTRRAAVAGHLFEHVFLHIFAASSQDKVPRPQNGGRSGRTRTCLLAPVSLSSNGEPWRVRVCTGTKAQRDDPVPSDGTGPALESQALVTLSRSGGGRSDGGIAAAFGASWAPVVACVRQDKLELLDGFSTSSVMSNT